MQITFASMTGLAFFLVPALNLKRQVIQELTQTTTTYHTQIIKEATNAGLKINLMTAFRFIVPAIYLNQISGLKNIEFLRPEELIFNETMISSLFIGLLLRSFFKKTLLMIFLSYKEHLAPPFKSYRKDYLR